MRGIRAGRVRVELGPLQRCCPRGTALPALRATNLPELCSLIAAQLGPVGAGVGARKIRLEVLDQDFDDWIGPLSLEDVPEAAVVRPRRLLLDEDRGAVELIDGGGGAAEGGRGWSLLDQESPNKTMDAEDIRGRQPQKTSAEDVRERSAEDSRG